MSIEQRSKTPDLRIVASKKQRLNYSDLASDYASIGAERKWTIEGAIEGSPVVVLAGPEKKGKSWILADLVCCVVTGGKWLGAFEAKVQGSAVVIENEYGGPEYARRLARLARGRGRNPKDLLRGAVRHYSAYDLCLDHENEAAKNLARDIKDDPPAIIIFDPFRNYIDGDENSVRDVVKGLEILSMLRDEGSCPVVAAHHLNNRGSANGSRGFKTRADLFIEGTDEDQPWYSTMGRTLRSGDPITKLFTVKLEHTNDKNDRIASTQLRLKFKGENRSKSDLSTTAKKLLSAIKDLDEPATSNRLGTITNTNGKVRSRGLDELMSAGLIKVRDSKYSLSPTEQLDDLKEVLEGLEP